MLAKTQFKFEIDLSPNGKVEKFENKEEFQEWLKIEKNFWNWGDFRAKEPNAYHFWNSINHKINSIEGALNNVLHNESDPNAFRYQLDQLKNLLSEFYKKGHLLHSSDPRAKFIDDLKNKDIVRATYTLKYFINNDFELNNKALFEGAFNAYLFELGIKGTSESEKAALEELRSIWESHLNSSKEALNKIINKYDQSFNDNERQKFNQNNVFDGFMRESTSNYQNLIDDSKRHFKAIEDSYDKKLALRASLKYWEDKKGNHLKWTWILVVSTTLAFLAFAYLVSNMLFKEIGNNTVLTIPFQKLGMVLLLITAGIWAIRIMVRLLLSHIHLKNDADERLTMLSTYLALLKEGKLKDEESRNFILHVLFRPSHTGIIKDDGIPPFVMELSKKITE